MKPLQITIKPSTWIKLEKYAQKHPDKFYASYDDIIEDILKNKR